MKPFAAGVALLTCACACAASPSALGVHALPRQYSPAMSSTPGIGLTVVFVPSSGTTVDYRWRADFGYFLAWNAPDFQTAPKGADLVASDARLYWTYDPKLAAVRKPVVTIDIEARDARSGRVLARRRLKLDWDRDTARVRD